MTPKPPMQPRGSVELYSKAADIHKKAYKRLSWNGEKYKLKTGHMLQKLFGKSVWTLKDLNDDELLKIIDFSEKKLSKTRNK